MPIEQAELFPEFAGSVDQSPNGVLSLGAAKLRSRGAGFDVQSFGVNAVEDALCYLSEPFMWTHLLPWRLDHNLQPGSLSSVGFLTSVARAGGVELARTKASVPTVNMCRGGEGAHFDCVSWLGEDML